MADGTVLDRPWGLTLGTVGLRKLTAQVNVRTDDGKDYVIAFIDGEVANAYSPLPNDVVTRVALTSHFVSPSQVGLLTRMLAAASDRDELEVVAEATGLAPEHITTLRRRLTIQRAARTFALDRGAFEIMDELTLRTVPDFSVPLAAVVFQGVRMNISQERLAEDLRVLGADLLLRPGVTEAELTAYDFDPQAGSIIDALRLGTTLAELEATHREIEPRTAQSIVYALVSCGSCMATGPSSAERTPTPTRPTSLTSGPHTVIRVEAPLVTRRAVSTTPPTNLTSTSSPTLSRTATPIPSRTATPTSVPLTSRTSTLPPTSRSATPTSAPLTSRTSTLPPTSRTATPTSVPLTSRTSTLPPTSRTATPTSVPPMMRPTPTSAPPMSSTPTTPPLARTPTLPPTSRTATPIPSRTSSPTIPRSTTPTARTSSPTIPRASSRPPRTTSPTGQPPNVPRTGTLREDLGDERSGPHQQDPSSTTGGFTALGSNPPVVSRTITAPRTITQRDRTAKEIEKLIAARLVTLESGADYFAILGVEQDAPPEVIRSAYLDTSRRLHPQSLTQVGVLDEDKSAQRIMAQVNAAFSVVSDPHRRREYMNALARGEATPIAPRARTGDLDKKELAAEAFALGEKALRREDLHVAVEELGRAVALLPTNHDYAAKLAWAQFCASMDKASVYPETRKSLERAINRADKPIDARFFLGRVERILGHDREAMKHFELILMEEPSHKDAATEVRFLEQRLAKKRR